jgi:uncharacterized protein YeaO (DUF488 family)
MTKIYTISIPNARRLGIDKIPGYIDITIGTGDRAFAPTWKMVKGIKSGTMSEDEYTDEYKSMMAQSILNYLYKWNDLIAHDIVYLACYCPPGAFCHRYILSNILAESSEDIEYIGEDVEGVH